MKTPEEIKKGLKGCKRSRCAYNCPYGDRIICDVLLHEDALTFIQQLETENHQLLTKAQQLESTISQVSKALCGKENATLKELLKAADQLKARAPRWISVEERLPEIAEHRGKYDVSVRVLCACLQKSGHRMVKEGYFEIFDGKYFKWRIPGTIDKVTHWMPLPNPPKEDDHAAD